MRNRLKVLIIIISVLSIFIVFRHICSYVYKQGWEVLTQTQETELLNSSLDLRPETLERLGYISYDNADGTVICFKAYESDDDKTQLYCDIIFDSKEYMQQISVGEISKRSYKVREEQLIYHKELQVRGEGYNLRIMVYTPEKSNSDVWDKLSLLLSATNNYDSSNTDGPDTNAGLRPRDYDMTRWISKDPEMWFIIDDSNSMINYQGYEVMDDYVYGGLVIDGEMIEIQVFFDKGSGISFSDKTDDPKAPFTQGDCEFSPEKLVVTIDKERDNYEPMKGKYDTITFIREPLKEE